MRTQIQLRNNVFTIDSLWLYFSYQMAFRRGSKCFFERCIYLKMPYVSFLCFSYEDGQVGDANINTQEGGIHKEILRVIGNQTATG